MIRLGHFVGRLFYYPSSLHRIAVDLIGRVRFYHKRKPFHESLVVNEQQKLTEQTLSRLRTYAKGNGIKPEDIQLIETMEAVYSLPARLILTPQCDIQSRSFLGRSKNKGHKVLSSFAELRTEVESLQKEFQQNAPWLEDAIKELEKTPGYGWGQHDAMLCWSDKKTIITATENCPTCRGTAQRTCPDCRGIGSLPCHDCEGRGREICTQCAGHKQDPLNPGNRCPTCNGTGFSLCRFCHGQMKIPCPSCQAKGNTPCGDCKGTGFVSQEAEITKGARMDFALGATVDMPSGLLSGLSRIGENQFIKGQHADFAMKPQSPDDPNAPRADRIVINLEARIPYADVKIKFSTKGAIISCFGKKGRLSGVPPFLDMGLTAARKILARAAQNDADIEGALAARAIKEAFELVLAGKSHPNDLRRLYPAGLSAATAQEIMGNLARYFRSSTAKLRMVAGGVCFALSATLFSALFFTPLYTSLSAFLGQAGILAFKVVFPLVVLAANWLGLQQAASIVLKRRFPALHVAGSQPIGKTGMGTLGAIAFLYILLLFLSGNLL